MISTYYEYFMNQSKIAAEAGREISAVKQLLCYVLDISAISFSASPDSLIYEVQQEAFEKVFQDYLNGKPVAYIVGESYFYGLVLKVTPDVLIPRYETEELVEWVNYDLRQLNTQQSVIADIGTGNGAIALAIKNQNDQAIVYATDLSESALSVAKFNADKVKLSVEFLQGDLALPLIAKGIKVDVLISNPPYIAEGDEVDASVIQYEPHIALFADENGFINYRRLLEMTPQVVRPGGKIYFEIGASQKEGILDLVARILPKSKVAVHPDMSGKDRIVIIDYIA